MARKLISEFVGTMLLVLFGCGTAVAANGYVYSVTGATLPFTMVAIALAFGLVLTAIVSIFGNVSGAHVNPAVTIAMAIDKRISVIECVEYIIVQILGGIVGAELLGIIFNSYKALGANGYAQLSALPSITTLTTALIVEILLTFTFVLVVLVVTSKKDKGSNGLVIGVTLALVHLMGIPFTGTSVNPARSIGPAIFTGGEYLSQLWVFILAPVVGGILAAIFFKLVLKEKEEVVVTEKVVKEIPTKVENKKKIIKAAAPVKEAAKKIVAKKEAPKKAAPKKETTKTTKKIKKDK